MSESNLSLEDHFSQLDEIITKMESPNLSLDESFELYKKGMEEIKAANLSLDKVEKAMLVLNDSNELEEF